VVFDKPIMLVNVCNQLGNCYLSDKNISLAKENFEQSLVLIWKLDKTTERVSDKVISAIYLNLAIIASQ
jgi:catabolite regulation protein CreA